MKTIEIYPGERTWFLIATLAGILFGVIAMSGCTDRPDPEPIGSEVSSLGCTMEAGHHVIEYGTGSLWGVQAVEFETVHAEKVECSGPLHVVLPPPPLAAGYRAQLVEADVTWEGRRATGNAHVHAVFVRADGHETPYDLYFPVDIKRMSN